VLILRGLSMQVVSGNNKPVSFGFDEKQKQLLSQ
jgi:hypothetical protein